MRSSVLIAALMIAGLSVKAGAAPPVQLAGTPGVSPTLTRFRSDAEFRRYVRQVQAAAERRYSSAAGRHGVQFAQTQGAPDQKNDANEPPPCPPDHPDCLPQAEQSVVVTGSRVAPHNASITNNQTVGVDEGDIVKQSGQFLLILQDGRIFSVDTKPGGVAGLAVADRMNVYRDPDDDTWYDEMLVIGDRVVITGYSYEQEAAEISVFRLGKEGRLTSLGTFFISANDYYSADNYASRLVGDKLVIYSPLEVSGIEPDKPMRWPLVRRWVPGETRKDATRAGRQLLDARNIYRPTVGTLEPVVHAISICPLAEAGGTRDLECRTTGFVGPEGREVYVSPEHAFVWTYAGWADYQAAGEAKDCAARFAGRSLAGAVYRLPLSGEEPDVLGVAGAPIDHFSLDASRGRLKALLRNPPMRCGEQDYSDEVEAPAPDPHLAFFTTSLEEFAEDRREAPERAYTAMPSPGSFYIANRFTDDYLVYGGMARWGSYPPDADAKPVPSRAFAVPVRNPAGVQPLAVPHTIIRAERAGDDIVLTGYRDATALDLSLVDLRGAPRVASTARLEGRYESEGRSHAFNSLFESDGSGIMGIPTAKPEKDSPRWWWRSMASDVSFLAADATGRLTPLGELLTGVKPKIGRWGIEEQAIPGYECEVSCIDWYGNTRPIFTDGRVFALTGAELIEGRVQGGAIGEVRRLLIAGPTRPRTP